MPGLERSEVKEVVTRSLLSIADLPAGDIETTPLHMLNSDQKVIFASSLKKNLNAVPYQLLDGTEVPNAHFDISLTINNVNLWNTVGDCIDFITRYQYLVD